MQFKWQTTYYQKYIKKYLFLNLNIMQLAGGPLANHQPPPNYPMIAHYHSFYSNHSYICIWQLKFHLLLLDKLTDALHQFFWTKNRYIYILKVQVVSHVSFPKNGIAAITFYFIYVTGILISLVYPAINKDSVLHAKIMGALFGILYFLFEY